MGSHPLTGRHRPCPTPRPRRLSPPHATIPDDIETEAARLAFLAAALAAALEHGGLALSARALYAADGRAARELLRLARVLLQAVQAAEQQQQLGGATAGPTAAPALLRPSDTALVRSHADALAGAGTKLAALLAEEPQLAEARAAAGRLLDVLAAGPGGDAAASAYHKVERSLGDAAAQTADEAGKMKARTTELGAALDGLREQLARRQAELGRARTRLEAVATLRPAHADELSRLHGDMAEEHAAYVTKCRNLDYLAAELAALRQVRCGAPDWLRRPARPVDRAAHSTPMPAPPTLPPAHRQNARRRRSRRAPSASCSGGCGRRRRAPFAATRTWATTSWRRRRRRPREGHRARQPPQRRRLRQTWRLPHVSAAMRAAAPPPCLAPAAWWAAGGTATAASSATTTRTMTKGQTARTATAPPTATGATLMTLTSNERGVVCALMPLPEGGAGGPGS